MKQPRIKHNPLVEAIFSASGISLTVSIMHSWWWLIPTGFLAAFAIWCWHAQRQEPNPYICSCGYSNTNTKALRCPECGKAIAAKQPDSGEDSL